MNPKFTHFLSLNLIQPLYNVVLPPSLTHFPGIGSRLAAVVGFAIVEYCIPDYRLGKTDGSSFKGSPVHVAFNQQDIQTKKIPNQPGEQDCVIVTVSAEIVKRLFRKTPFLISPSPPV